MTLMTSQAHAVRPENPWLDTTIGRLSLLNSFIAASLIVLMMLLICGDIIGRDFFSIPINGVSDFVSYCIVAIVFLQLGSTIRNNRLVNAVFLTDALKSHAPRLNLALQTIFSLAAISIMSITVRYLWRDFLGAWTENEFLGAAGAYQIVTWPFKLAVAFGATLALIELVLAIFRAYSTKSETGLASKLAVGILAAVLFGVGFLALDLMAEAGLDRVAIGFCAMAALLVLVTLGMPIAFSLMITSFVGIWLVRDNMMVSINSVGISASSAVRSYGIGVLPLFVLMGLLLDRAGVGRDAFQIMALLVRRIVGGLGVATVGANAIFASITGSSIASATVFSRIAVRPMTEAGYSKKFSLGIVAGSSVLGMLIPPSLLMIVYGLLSETSIGALFIAGIVPGLLLAAAFAVLIVLLARFAPGFAGRSIGRVDFEPASVGDVVSRLAPVLFIVGLVMGGIYGGFFSPTEAGAVGAAGAVIIALVRRSMTWDDFKKLAIETGAITAGLLFLMIAANVYARMLSMTTLPMQMANVLSGLDLTLIGFALVYMVVVILLGMILDSVSIMLLVLPIALPVISTLNADPIWFGIVTVVAIEIGLLTPPFGLSVYVVKGSLPEGYATLGEIFLAVAPFALVMVAVTVMLILFPGLATVLL